MLARAQTPTNTMLGATGQCWCVYVGVSRARHFNTNTITSPKNEVNMIVKEERPTLPNAQDRFLLPVHRVWWSGLFVCFMWRARYP